MIFFTADTHFGHKNIIEYCKRPFSSVDEMNRIIIENWNSVITPEDTVYHLGDVAFHRGLDCVRKLNGKLILISGNHDKRMHKCKFREVGFELLENKSKVWRFNLAHWPHPQNFDKNFFNLCGHVHGAWKEKDGWLNVGQDVWNYKPVSITEVIGFFVTPYMIQEGGEL